MPVPGKVAVFTPEVWEVLWIQIQGGCKYYDQPDIATMLSNETTTFRTEMSKTLGKL